LKLQHGWISSETPAKEYEGLKRSNWPARIVDKGDEVDVVANAPNDVPHVGGRIVTTRYFRTEQACRATEQAEQRELDPYR
jgi:hypothetical protein